MAGAPYTAAVKSLAPGFLIAMPQLHDPNFQKSVVLMIEHAEGGSMGLVINRQAPLTLAELGKSQILTISSAHSEGHLFIGGPVEPHRGFVLHDSSGVEERTAILPGLYLSVTSDSLKTLLADPAPRLRFCLGYSGWGPGQVEKEIKSGSWLFTEASRANVLTTAPDEVWEEVIKGMGFDPGMLVTTGGVN